uniref:Alpha-type protein kinase domain-containing protein n=1 Tax=Panagrolaimus sp. ES5 TaxID=591445 RepID=A0AC34FKG4_9BILA
MDDNTDKCGRCGGVSHKLDQCPAKDYYCHICGKTGHYLEFCISPVDDGSISKTPSLNNGKSIGGCKHCGTTHAYRNCPAHNSKCFECQGKGHFPEFCHSLKQGSSKNSPTLPKNKSGKSTPVTPQPLKSIKRQDSGSSSSSKSIIKEKPKINKVVVSSPDAFTNNCNKCGTSHEPNKCPAKNAYCSICKKNEHFEEFCIFKDKNKQQKSHPSTPNPKKECKKCGKIHAFDECPAKNSVCQCCKKPGHFYDFCKFKNVENDCGKCGDSHLGQTCPAKNEYCKKCHLQGHFTQCCRKATPEKIEEWKRDEQNALCRYIFTMAKEDYGRNASGPVLEKRKKEAIEIRQKQIDKTAKELKKARNLELCFLVDATGTNMSQYGWADNVRLAFVAYRDFGDSKQFEWLNNGKFTESIKDFKDFCEKLDACGGGDDAEDVFGGLDKALSLDWCDEYGTKIIYHIADAPCHGKKYHNLKQGDDKFYDLGHPNGLTDKRLFSKLRQIRIQYFFGKISNDTDKMIGISEAAAIMCFEESNEREYKIVEKEPNWDKLNEILATVLNYELMESIEEITQREFTLLMPLQFDSIKIAPNPFAKGGDRLAYFGKMITKNGIKDQVFKEYLSVNNKDNISINYKIPNEISTIASFFAQKFNKKIKNAIEEGYQTRISFLKIKTIRMRENDENGKEKIRYLCAENRFCDNEKFYKFTNNATFFMTESNAKKNGIDLKLIEMLLAFSHFTYQESNGYLMIVDLQGVINQNEDGTKKLVLTDPSIHCKNLLRFGKTNFGEKGMKNFFDQHRCNSFCKLLGHAFKDNTK